MSPGVEEFIGFQKNPPESCDVPDGRIPKADEDVDPEDVVDGQNTEKKTNYIWKYTFYMSIIADRSSCDNEH